MMEMWFTVPEGHVKRIFEAARILCAGMAFGLLTTSPARAGVSVSGPANDLTVEVDRASLADVLAAIDTHYPIQLQASIELGAEVSGTFRGPLGKVVARLLQSYDYIVSPTPPGSRGTLKIVVLSGRDASETTGSIRPIPVSEAVAEPAPAPRPKKRRQAH